jgi:hypothetical protein
MGGKVFTTTANPLFTPRMPPEVYFYVREQCHAILSKFYTYICTPIEAPEKSSYGDIDILVCGPLPSPSMPISEIGWALDATSAILPLASSTGLPANYALPWPLDEDLPEQINYATADPAFLEALETGKERFIQVDLETIPDYATFHFLSFTHAHSGLFTLLGAPLRDAGLVLNHSSLSLRIPAIEALHRRHATILLTADPDQILDFLGLDRESYWKQFGTTEEMFEYVASCRLFTTRPRQDAASGTEQAGAEPKVRHRDRHNYRRPLLVKWREEFLPRARAAGKYDRDVPSRDAIREGAFAAWPQAKELYDAKVKAFEIEQQHEEVGRRINAEVATGVEALELPLGFRSTAVRGLRRIVFDSDETYGVMPDKPLRRSDGFWDVESVTAFARMNWKEVGIAGMERGHAKMVDKKAAKKAKEEKESIWEDLRASSHRIWR